MKNEERFRKRDGFEKLEGYAMAAFPLHPLSLSQNKKNFYQNLTPIT